MNQQHPQTQQPASHPIIQKLIIYGGLSISRIRQNEIKVGILRCFSYNTQTQQVIQTTHQDEDKYQIWVYPDGIKIYDTSYEVINDPEPQFSFSQPNIIHPQKLLGVIDSTQFIKEPLDNVYPLVLTDYDLNRTYCTCLVWNEKRFVQNDEDQFTDPVQLEKTVTLKPQHLGKIPNLNSKILPKCTLNELIQDPLILDPTSSLVYIPKGIILCSPHPCLTFQRQLISFLYINGIKKHGEATLHKKEMDQLRNLIAKFGYPQAQRFYDQEEFLNQRQVKMKQEEKEMPLKPYQLHSKKTYLKMEREKKENQLNLHNLRTLQKKKLQQFYLSVAFLPQLIQSPNPSEIPTQVIQLQDTITSSHLSPFQPYYFSSTCFRMPNFNILATIQKIGINNLLTLWKNALLQRQILVFSSDQFLTLQVFETILYLLQPLKWQNIYVPFLPFHLCHHIQALGGYLIGMSKIHMNYMIEHFNLQSKVFVDLDQMIIIEEGGNANTQLPLPIRHWMVKQLETLGFEEKEKKPIGKETLWQFTVSRLRLAEDQRKQSQDKSQQQTIQTIFQLHRTFYMGLFYLLNNYSSYISQQGSTVRFSRQDYLTIFSPQDKIFASQVIKTMMFIRLCQFHKNAEKSLKWNQSDICSLFVYCHYIMKQDQMQEGYWEIEGEEGRNTQKLNEYVNYVVRKNIKQLTSATAEWKTYKIEHYLVKYLNYKNYNSPGIIKMEETQPSAQTSQWLQWIWQLLKKQQVEKQQKKKKQKLNQMYDFFSARKTLLNLNKLFQNIGGDLFSGLRKNLGVEGWTNAKVIDKMRFNRENAKSSQSAS